MKASSLAVCVVAALIATAALPAEAALAKPPSPTSAATSPQVRIPPPPPNGALPRHRGPHVMPIRGHQGSGLSTAAVLPGPSGAHLTYFGGRVVSNIKVIQVLWGTGGVGGANGQFMSGVKNTTSPSIATFYQGVLNSSYVDWLDGDYNTIAPSGTKTNQHIKRGSFAGQYAITPRSSATTVDDSTIQSEIAFQIGAGHLPAPEKDSANNAITYYSVFFPHGDTITQGGSNSCQAGGFYAYHGTASVSSQEYYYGAHPDMQAGSGCEFGVGAPTLFGDQTIVASHELIETMTDPEVGLAPGVGPPLAWYDSTNGEIADICQGNNGTATGSDAVSYDVQYVWSNSQNGCVIDGPVAVTNDFSVSAAPMSVSIAAGGSGTSTISTAIVSGTAQTVALAASGVPSGVTAQFTPASVTTGQSSTLTLTSTSAATPGSYTISVTGTATSGSHIATVALTVTGSTGTGLINGGFETGTLAGWTSTGTTGVVNSGAHSGTYAARLGSTSPTNGDSSITQTFTAPADATVLSFYYKVTCPDVVTYDWATATLTDNTASITATVLAKTCTTVGAWTPVTAALVAGHSYTLALVSHDDNYSGDPTYTLYDDVTITTGGPPGPGLTNGGFETGTLSGWTSAGTTSIVSSGAHSGTYAARLGSTSATNGDSSITQTFTAPAGATGLSFDFNVTCPDTVTFDWATATLTDNTASTTATVLAKTCTAVAAWQLATAPLTAGHSYTLALVNHDDNYSGDPTYTLYDDVTVVSSTAPPQISSGSSATFTVAAPGSFTVASSGNPTPSLSRTGSLPAGVSFVDNGDGTATLSGTPQLGTAGNYPLTFTAHNGVGSDATQAFMLTVTEDPALITTTTSATFTVAAAGSFTVKATGTPTPSLSQGGVLPSGVGFVDNGDGSATLSGTPLAGTGGTYALTFTAHNGVGSDATQAFTLTVTEPAVITSATSATFDVGAAGSFTVTSTGTPLPTLTDGGTLPNGVGFVDNGDGTATLSGSPDPDTAGSYPVTLTAHNGVGSDATQTFTLTVDDQTPPDISYALNPATPGSGGWYNTPVSLTWTVSEPQSPSALVTTGCIDYVISVDQAQTTYSCSATSTGGSSGPVTVTIGYDATAPILTPSLPAGTVFAVGTPAPAVAPGATDATSGVASSSCTPVHTGSVGVRSVTCSATDNAGNTSTVKVAYTVTDAFLGFVSPQPKTSHHHGATVAIKFTLGTYAGTARVSTSAVQVRITPLGAPTTVAASATCLYNTAARLYRCDTVMPVAPGAYRIKVWEQVGTGSKGAIYTPLQNAFAVLGKPNANPEAITVN